MTPTNAKLNRRSFMKVLSAVVGTTLTTTAAGVIVGAAVMPDGAKGRQLKSIGIQLYTVRDQMKLDVVATLKAIASFGYKEVEFAGYFGIAAKEVKKILNGEGLTSPSCHVALNVFDKDIHGALDRVAEVGHEYVTVPSLGKKLRTLDGYKMVAEQFNLIGEEANKRGIRFGYHNHAFEFDVIDGLTPYDILLDRVEQKNMQFTMDFYWIIFAGKDPLAYFKRHPGRFEQCHVKDMDAGGKMVDVGDGVIDFGKYFSQSELAGLKHYYVENDRPADSMKCAEKSARHLLELTF